MDFLQIGPLALALDRALAIVAVATFVGLCGVLSRRAGRPLEGAAWLAAATGAVVARGAYALEHRAAFATDPWSVLAFWQGGFSPAWGIAAAALVLALRLRVVRPALHALAALVAATLAWLAAERLVLQEEPEPLPAVTVRSLDGAPVPLREVAGVPLVVNVWATWCPPCRRELPLLADVASERRDVRFVFLASGEDAATVRAYLDASGLRLTAVRVDVDRSATAALRVQGLPTTLFVAADGSIVERHAGEIGRAALLEGLSRASRP